MSNKSKIKNKSRIHELGILGDRISCGYGYFRVRNEKVCNEQMNDSSKFCSILFTVCIKTFKGLRQEAELRGVVS